jgi:hypothetical protein
MYVASCFGGQICDLNNHTNNISNACTFKFGKKGYHSMTILLALGFTKTNQFKNSGILKYYKIENKYKHLIAIKHTCIATIQKLT